MYSTFGQWSQSAWCRSSGLLRTVHLANDLSLPGVGAVGSYVRLANGLSLPGVGAVGSYVQYFWPMVSVCLV